MRGAQVTKQTDQQLDVSIQMAFQTKRWELSPKRNTVVFYFWFTLKMSSTDPPPPKGAERNCSSLCKIQSNIPIKFLRYLTAVKLTPSICSVAPSQAPSFPSDHIRKYAAITIHTDPTTNWLAPLWEYAVSPAALLAHPVVEQ